MSKKYKNPPINEIVMGVYFKQPIMEFRAEHVGLYWSQISSKFQKSAQNIAFDNMNIITPGEIYPLPRFWFISKDDSYLIQVQKNAFFLNWRKRQGGYPHYEPFKNMFDKYYEDFVKFCQEELGVSDLEIARCELMYINVVEDTKYFQSFDDVKEVIPSYAPITISGGEAEKMLSGLQLHYAYDGDESRSLSVTIEKRHNLETSNEVLYFDLKCAGVLSSHSKSDADIWFDRAHNVIGDTFNGLTNPDIQSQYWQPREA